MRLLVVEDYSPLHESLTRGLAVTTANERKDATFTQGGAFIDEK